MRRPVRTGSCLLAWIAVAAAGAAAGPGPASAQGFDVPALLRRAEMRVFELKVTRNGGVLQSAGSAVALSKSPTAADGTVVAIFATAYHVMESAESFEIANHAGKPVARSGPGTRCFAFRTKDVAFIRVALEPNAAGLVEEMPTKASLPSPVQSGPSAEHVGGLAFGFSRERTLPIDYSQIELLGPAGADRLELIRSAAGFRPGQNEEAPSNMTFRLASRDPTWSGMSGGLVVDREFHFAGLVFGRQLDRYNIIIPADVVAAALGAAGDPARWAEFGTDSFRGMSPFRGTGDARDDEPIVDRREWGTIDGLIELIGEDPTLAIAQFQEITVNPPDTGKNSEVAVVVRDDCFKGGRKQSIEMSLDGGPPVALRLNASFRIPLDRDGEALLLVKKTSGDINDFEIGRFLAPSIVDLSFQQNNHEFLRVIRSLPQAVQAYPLFVAVRRSPPREPKPVADRPANARVAIRIDYAQGLLNQAPFRLGLKEGAGKSHFEGTYRLDPANGWELEYGSSQQLRIRAAGSVCVADARHEEVELVLNPDQLNKRYPIAVRGRVQFPSEFGNFFISARATGTSGTFPLRVKLSNALEADLGGVLRYLFTTYLNNRLLFQGAPRMTEKGTVGRFLGELGLASPQGWKPLDPRQVVLVRTAGGHTWLIATVRIDRPREGDRADDGAALPELLIPPVRRGGRGLRYHGVRDPRGDGGTVPRAQAREPAGLAGVDLGSRRSAPPVVHAAGSGRRQRLARTPRRADPDPARRYGEALATDPRGVRPVGAPRPLDPLGGPGPRVGPGGVGAGGRARAAPPGGGRPRRDRPRRDERPRELSRDGRAARRALRLPDAGRPGGRSRQRGEPAGRDATRRQAGPERPGRSQRADRRLRRGAPRREAGRGRNHDGRHHREGQRLG